MHQTCHGYHFLTNIWALVFLLNMRSEFDAFHLQSNGLIISYVHHLKPCTCSCTLCCNFVFVLLHESWEEA